MKPGKLYLRIFLSFLVFLIITEIAIFAVFILGFGRNYQHFLGPEPAECREKREESGGWGW